ncbi:GNAT family N-acetyltransferase [Levilactobacillus andaensis]|uniref:GNAT family N-acetyltransferase n=1 Tax=Levilactobacillus andaensis TaxID=2799570 RepID=UPI001944D80E|nr:GNAT family N-acetyltransferase [Levilactobacillus andaensis]
MKLEIYQDTQRDRECIAQYPLKDPTFTATPRQALAIALGDPERMPILVMVGSEMVGFFVLTRNEDVREVGADPATAILIRSLSVSETQRGKGIATQMLQQLPAFAREHFPLATTLNLAVEAENVPAQKLYDKVGFVDTGRRRFGQYGEQYILTKAL